jgi:hypothetical protein
MILPNTVRQVEIGYRKLMSIIRLTPHHGKNQTDIEFATGLMVKYNVAKAYFGNGLSGLNPISNLFIPM